MSDEIVFSLDDVIRGQDWVFAKKLVERQPLGSDLLQSVFSLIFSFDASEEALNCFSAILKKDPGVLIRVAEDEKAQRCVSAMLEKDLDVLSRVEAVKKPALWTICDSDLLELLRQYLGKGTFSVDQLNKTYETSIISRAPVEGPELGASQQVKSGSPSLFSVMQASPLVISSEFSVMMKAAREEHAMVVIALINAGAELPSDEQIDDSRIGLHSEIKALLFFAKAMKAFDESKKLDITVISNLAYAVDCHKESVELLVSWLSEAMGDLGRLFPEKELFLPLLDALVSKQLEGEEELKFSNINFMLDKEFITPLLIKDAMSDSKSPSVG